MDNKFYFRYLIKLVDEYNITYYYPIAKNLVMLVVLLSGCLKNLTQVIKFLNLKILIESGLPSIRIFLAKVTLKNGRKKFM